MTTLLPTIVTFLYAGTAMAFALKREWSWAGVWASYAAANVFLIFSQPR